MDPRAQLLAAEGAALAAEGRLAAAEAKFREALALETTAPLLFSLGSVRQLAGDYAGAEARHRRALELAPADPHIRAALGQAILAQGRLAEGFALAESWRDVPGVAVKRAPDVGLPPWRGEDVAGKKVLLWSEEGFGDQIMYGRFAPLLKAAGAKVAWACPPPLARLIEAGLGIQAIATRDGAQVERVDYIVPTSSLPAVFLQRMAEPPPAPYLRPPPPNTIPGLTVGVVAHGNPDNRNDRNRSLDPEAAAELLGLPGAVSLLPEDTGARDFYDTASVVAGLDLVITVDTAVAHLAGALGKPVWLLLPAIGVDWRWQGGTGPCRWYPAVRYFRQATPRDWSGVLAEVREALGAR